MAPSTYYAARDRAPSAGAVNDAALIPRLVSLWEKNSCVHGVLKLWKAAREYDKSIWPRRAGLIWPHPRGLGDGG